MCIRDRSRNTLPEANKHAFWAYKACLVRGRSNMSRSAPIFAAGLLSLVLVGCAMGSRTPATYDLIAPRAFAGSQKTAPYQLVVYQPTTVSALETNRLMVRPQADQISYYKGVAWSDRLPVLVQARPVSYTHLRAHET